MKQAADSEVSVRTEGTVAVDGAEGHRDLVDLKMC